MSYLPSPKSFLAGKQSGSKVNHRPLTPKDGWLELKLRKDEGGKWLLFVLDRPYQTQDAFEEDASYALEETKGTQS